MKKSLKKLIKLSQKLETYFDDYTTIADLSCCDIDFNLSYSDNEERVIQYIYENFDIIYYVSAMEFLQKNDPSLQESLSLADEMGYSANNLNSEILATLLNQKFVLDDFYGSNFEEDFIDINNFLDKIQVIKNNDKDISNEEIENLIEDIEIFIS